jgi:hypothetical protein
MKDPDDADRILMEVMKGIAVDPRDDDEQREYRDAIKKSTDEIRRGGEVATPKG